MPSYQTSTPHTVALHVLVVEDYPLNQRLAITALTRLGHTGVVVGDGAKALRCLEQHQFDLILMDIMMPTMDGLEALSILREREKQGRQRTPVVMVTGHTMPGDRERLIQFGADGYLAKPLIISELQTEIARVLRR